jgi:hypothetical protein
MTWGAAIGRRGEVGQGGARAWLDVGLEQMTVPSSRGPRAQSRLSTSSRLPRSASSSGAPVGDLEQARRENLEKATAVDLRCVLM